MRIKPRWVGGGWTLLASPAWAHVNAQAVNSFVLSVLVWLCTLCFVATRTRRKSLLMVFALIGGALWLYLVTRPLSGVDAPVWELWGDLGVSLVVLALCVALGRK